MTRLAVILACGVAVLSGQGCAPRRIGMEVMWPPPPEVARIKFVTAFRSSSELDLSVGGELLRQALGGSRDAEITQPRGIAVSGDGKRLYIADQGAQAVLLADFEKKALIRFSSDDDIEEPFGVAVDSAGDVYVTDQRRKSIAVFDSTGRVKRRFGQNEGLIRPSGIAIDRARGFVYVSDPASVKSTDHRVLKYRTDGTFVGAVGKGRGTDNGEFNFPMFLDVDGQGQLFVADMMNFRIQVFDRDGTFVRKYGESGSEPGTFSRLKGLAHDSFGNLYVVDGDHATVQIFNSEFEPLMYFGGPVPKLEYMSLPIGIAIDGATNRIYVANGASPPRINVYELINTSAADSKALPK